MKYLIKFVKENWADPVWSKVFAAIIIGFLMSILTLVTSLLRKIPIKTLFHQATTTYIWISWLWLIIFFLLFLVLLISTIAISIKRSNIKKGSFLKVSYKQKIDLQKFIVGNWILKYTRQSDNHIGSEPVFIKNANHYYVRNLLTYLLADIQIIDATKEILWTKIRLENNKMHSKEFLTIIDDNTIKGTDNLGFELTYHRINK